MMSAIETSMDPLTGEESCLGLSIPHHRDG